MIQFPKSEHVTLPSVSGGFGSMNILRDPPKARYTRFIPKVGETTRISQWIDTEDTGDRICEMIRPFARGVNQMVSVSYSNYGTDGGQNRFIYGETPTNNIASIQAHLPYKVNREGAFRPPLIPPEQLLPLSRLPRNVTSAEINKGSQERTLNSLLSCNVDLRSIRNQLLQVCALPKVVYNIETTHGQPYETINHINKKKYDILITNIDKKNLNNGQLQENKNPNKRNINHNLIYKLVEAKPTNNIETVVIAPYTQNIKENILKGNFMTNKDIKSRQELILNNNKVLTRNIPIIYNNTSNKNGINGRACIPSNSLILDRKIPIVNSSTNLNTNGDAHRNDTRNVKLPPKLSLGCFENKGFEATF